MRLSFLQINFSQTRWKFLGSSFVSLYTGLVGSFTSRFDVYVLVKLEIYWDGFSPKDSAGSLKDLQKDHGCLYYVLAYKDYTEMYVCMPLSTYLRWVLENILSIYILLLLPILNFSNEYKKQMYLSFTMW